MKTRDFRKLLLSVAAGAALAALAPNLSAQDSSAAVDLSYGASQVLQLSKANVGDAAILAYVKNTPNHYNLNAAAILYLRQQGVSEPVLVAMLDQTSQPAPAPSPSQPNSYVAAQPSVIYQAAPAPSSRVYVIPNSQAYNYYLPWPGYYSDRCYPYYSHYPYYRYPFPAVSLSFGFGHGYYRHSHHSGFRHHH